MSKNLPLVSVIIPVYNGDPYLKETIESVLKQTYQPIEVIVIDDGSTDNSANLARSYQDIHYIHQPNQGVSVARNTGVSHAHGEFIAFIDQDDLWTSNKLQVQVNYLLTHEAIGYVLAKMHTFLEQGTDQPRWLKKEFLDEDITGYIVGTLVVRKSILDSIGEFNPIYKFGNDSDWFFRAHDSRIPMTILPETLLHKRIHNTNESHKLQAMTEDILKVVRSSVHRKRKQKN